MLRILLFTTLFVIFGVNIIAQTPCKKLTATNYAQQNIALTEDQNLTDSYKPLQAELKKRPAVKSTKQKCSIPEEIN